MKRGCRASSPSACRAETATITTSSVTNFPLPHRVDQLLDGEDLVGMRGQEQQELARPRFQPRDPAVRVGDQTAQRVDRAAERGDGFHDDVVGFEAIALPYRDLTAENHRRIRQTGEG